MQIVLDFVTGKVSCEEFQTAWDTDPAIRLWVENLIDLKSPPPPEWAAAPYPWHRMAIHKHYGGSVLAYIEASEKSQTGKKAPAWVQIGWHFPIIAAVVTAAYPDIKATTYYDDEQDYCLSVVGDCLGGPEVEQQIAAVLEQFPRSMGKGKRKKQQRPPSGNCSIWAASIPDGSRSPSGLWVCIRPWSLSPRSATDTGYGSSLRMPIPGHSESWSSCIKFGDTQWLIYR